MWLVDVLNGETLTALDDATARTEIAGVTCDSRRVEPGFLFAALPGSQADGRAYIEDAIRKGASAIMVPAEQGPDRQTYPAGVAVIRDDNPRHRYARMAAAFHATQPAHVGAVTGTNGKTSVAWFARQLLNAAGMSAGSAGTLGMLATRPDGAEAFAQPGSLTTPDPADLHRDLAAMAAAGVDHLVMEASSHGLDQCRLDGVTIAAAAFTNLTRDHLDYHGSEGAYLAAKLRLVTELVTDGGNVIVNADAPHADAFAAAASKRSLGVIRVGSAMDADYRLVAVDPHATGFDLRLATPAREIACRLPLIGAFQASNAVIALALAVALGADEAAALAGMQMLRAAPGRMHLAGRHPSGAGIFVDYAHTPDALATVLKALRPHAERRLHVVFGCGGDRDRGKRPEMGKIATDLADRVIVTDDNPRSEDPAAIRAAIVAAAPGAEEIADRHAAIRAAIAELEAGDILVVAGKGHERGQTVAGVTHPFDDAEEVSKALRGVTI